MVGEVTTQGDRAIRANVARQWFGLDGRGITIGIISDSFNALRESKNNIRAGDLPGAGNPNGRTRSVRVLQDLPSGSDEGRALAQILFDIAPGAKLLFHTTENDEQGFAQAVRALTAAGADIIMDDILLATSTFFQDGLAAQAVNEAVAQGITYVTAAGNNSDRSYQSLFRGSNTFTFRGNAYTIHDFDGGAGVDWFQDIRIPAGAEIDLILNWAQPSGQVDTEVELFLLDRPQLPGAGGRVLASGMLMSGREADPSRRLFYAPTTDETVYLLIASRSNLTAPAPDPGLLQWISFSNASDRGTVYQYVNDIIKSSGGTIYGHQNAAGAITVGAVPVTQTPAFGITPPILEVFSSEGSVPILFDAQGNRRVVAADRQKPELVAPNRVVTTVRGFESFTGTSAAAPHVAATVALMLQRAGGRDRLTSEQLLTALQQTALPVVNSQAGLLQANAAVLQAVGAAQIGTIADDLLQGRDIAENLVGLSGHDTLKGAGGFDALWGDTGNDHLWGDRGNDYLLGQGDQDRLVGGLGRDWLNGGRGRDTLAGGKGRNTLIGGQGKDYFLLNRQGFAQIRDFIN
jgi:subtilisin family serine protease